MDYKIHFAPLQGYTDAVYREVHHRIFGGVENYYTPFVRVEKEGFRNKELRDVSPEHNRDIPVIPQLIAATPDEFRRIAAFFREQGYRQADINMGCPVNKVVKGTDGCALMRNVDLAQEIVRTVKAEISIPLSVKFRLGYTFDELNFVEYGQKMQEAGADFITIHGRTRSQMYGGKADWKKIAELKRNVDIPVFANGDVVSIETAVQCLDESEADGIAIGRGALGDPSLLYRVERYINAGEYLPPPTLEEKIETLKHHLKKEVEFRGENVGVKFCRKFIPYYLNGFQGASRLRGELILIDNLNEIFSRLDKILVSV